MRAIIIDDKDARALLDQLSLAKSKDVGVHISARLDAASVPEPLRKELVDEIHRHFHYVVCRWLQDQGANTVR